MVPRLSIILPRNLRSCHSDNSVHTKTTMNTISMNMTRENATVTSSLMSQTETSLLGNRRLISQAMVPPMISHSL